MQTLSLDENIYILLILGIVAVGAHAYTLFNQKLPVDDSSARWRFLNSIPIQLVTSRQKFNLGFLVYLLLFEFIYLILASSSSLVSMLYQLSGREALTGALSESVKPNGAIPILASTAIILFSQIRPFARFEQWIRGYTHQLASIPEGLRSVKHGVTSWLNRQQHRSDARQQHPGQETEESLASDCVANTADSETHPTDPDHVGAWARRVIDDKKAAELFERSYRNVMLLSDYTLETTGSTVWDAAECEEILQIFQPTEHEVAKLRYDIRNAMERVFPTDEGPIPEAIHTVDDSASPTNNTRTDPDTDELNVNASTKEAAASLLKPLIKQCMNLEERLIMLFSLLSINQPDAYPHDDRKLESLLAAAHRREPSFITHLTLRTVVAGGVTALFLILGFFLVEDTIRETLRASPHATKAPFGNYVDERIASNLEAAPHSWQQGFALSERRAAAVDAEILFANTSQTLVKSLQELAGILLLFAPAVMVALAIRERHVKTKQWAINSHRFKETLPIGKYYSTCGYAAMASLSTVFVFYFGILSLLPAISHDKDVLSLSVIQPFIDFIPSLLSTGLIAFVCGYFALYVFDMYRFAADQSNEESVRPETDKRQTTIAGTRLAALALYFSAVCALINLTTSLSIGTVNSWWDVGQRLLIYQLGFLALFIWFTWFTDRYHSALAVDRSAEGLPDAPVEMAQEHLPEPLNESDHSISDKSVTPTRDTTAQQPVDRDTTGEKREPA